MSKGKWVGLGRELRLLAAKQPTDISSLGVATARTILLSTQKAYDESKESANKELALLEAQRKEAQDARDTLSVQLLGKGQSINFNQTRKILDLIERTKYVSDKLGPISECLNSYEELYHSYSIDNIGYDVFTHYSTKMAMFAVITAIGAALISRAIAPLSAMTILPEVTSIIGGAGGMALYHGVKWLYLSAVVPISQDTLSCDNTKKLLPEGIFATFVELAVGVTISIASLEPAAIEPEANREIKPPLSYKQIGLLLLLPIFFIQQMIQAARFSFSDIPCEVIRAETGVDLIKNMALVGETVAAGTPALPSDVISNTYHALRWAEMGSHKPDDLMTWYGIKGLLQIFPLDSLSITILPAVSQIIWLTSVRIMYDQHFALGALSAVSMGAIIMAITAFANPLLLSLTLKLPIDTLEETKAKIATLSKEVSGIVPSVAQLKEMSSNLTSIQAAMDAIAADMKLAGNILERVKQGVALSEQDEQVTEESNQNTMQTGQEGGNPLKTEQHVHNDEL